MMSETWKEYFEGLHYRDIEGQATVNVCGFNGAKSSNYFYWVSQ